MLLDMPSHARPAIRTGDLVALSTTSSVSRVAGRMHRPTCSGRRSRRARRRTGWSTGAADDGCGREMLHFIPIPEIIIVLALGNSDGPRNLRVLAACDASGPAYSHARHRHGFFARVCVFRIGGGSAGDSCVPADSASILAVRGGRAWDHSVLNKAMVVTARWRRSTSLYLPHSSPARQSARAGQRTPEKRSVNPSRLERLHGI